MKKVAIIGHFGLKHNCLDGQTVKTKIITDELINRLGEDQVRLTDTHGGKRTLFKAPFQVFRALKTSSNVIILPAHNGLRVFVPLLNFFRKFFKNRKLHYVVIGGWLPEFLKTRKSLLKKLKRFNGIYVETNTMKTALEQMGFTNVLVLPNCKKLNIVETAQLNYDYKEPYKLCTFSRVMKEKGIEDAVNAVKAVNEYYGRDVYSLDIYGQVDSAQTEWFEQLKANFPSNISYGGLVEFDKSTEVLKDYFALLFPTYYDGEGFAGTLIDAFAAGIPVVASDWKYNTEIVKDNQTGKIFQSKREQELVDILKWIYENKEKWISMKINCINSAVKYLPETALEVLFEKII